MKILLLGLSLILFLDIWPESQELSKHKYLKYSNSVIQILNKISRHNIYECKTIGIAGIMSEQFQRFEKLVKVATTEELIQISRSHENPVVRLYAFQGLKREGILIPKDIQEKFNNDKSEIQTLCGCFGNISKVNELSKENISKLY